MDFWTDEVELYLTGKLSHASLSNRIQWRGHGSWPVEIHSVLILIESNWLPSLLYKKCFQTRALLVRQVDFWTDEVELYLTGKLSHANFSNRIQWRGHGSWPAEIHSVLILIESNWLPSLLYKKVFSGFKSGTQIWHKISFLLDSITSDPFKQKLSDHKLRLLRNFYVNLTSFLGGVGNLRLLFVLATEHTFCAYF